MDVEQRGFDYGTLAPEVRDRVEAATRRLHELAQRTGEAIIAIGRELLDVKASLPHGQFGVWLDREFGWSPATARRFMQVAEQFGENAHVERFQVSALYVLAANTTPEAVRQEFMARAEQGETVTVRDVRARLDVEPERPVDFTEARSRLREAINRETWQAPDLDRDDDEPVIDAEIVDPSDPTAYAWTPPAGKPTPKDDIATEAELVVAELRKRFSRSKTIAILEYAIDLAAG